MDETAERTLTTRCRETFGDRLRLAFWYSTAGVDQYGFGTDAHELLERADGDVA